jgi:hypothetical protein
VSSTDAAIRELISFSLNISDVDRSPVEDCTTRGIPTRQGQCIYARDRSMVSNYAEYIVAFHLKDRRIVRIAQARCGLDQGVEHPLQIEGRPADDLQNIGGRRLLFQRLG